MSNAAITEEQLEKIKQAVGEAYLEVCMSPASPAEAKARLVNVFNELTPAINVFRELDGQLPGKE